MQNWPEMADKIIKLAKSKNNDTQLKTLLKTYAPILKNGVILYIFLKITFIEDIKIIFIQIIKICSTYAE